MPEPIQFEHYEVLKNEDGSLVELGRGAMGITYKAFDQNLHCHVALKVISGRLLEDATAAERFLREARSAAQLRHRNVASVFHLGKHGDSYFYAMEFIDGETVTARVKREGPLSCLLALDIAQQVCAALIAADAQQLVHRDIKPSNLMLTREADGEMVVKVIDFGLAKSAVMQTSANLTLGGFVGTPYFASPEQLDRQPEDIRSDIYSLGVTLWFMLTGKPTFMGSIASVIAQHLDRSPPFEDLAILPAEVVAVLRQTLEKDREKRIQNPIALRGELKSRIEQLRHHQTPGESLSISGEGSFGTIALGGSGGPVTIPSVGALLKGRYRLIEDLNPNSPGRTYHGEDVTTRTRVAIRLFEASQGSASEIEDKARKVQAISHPNFLKVLAIEREQLLSFAVFEWLEGFSLVDLLRVRQVLTLREACMLLKQMAPAVDRALAAHLNLEMNLRDVMIHFPDGFGESGEDVVLRCPLDEWPAFVVKLNALGKVRAPGDTISGNHVRPGENDSPVEHAVIGLGILVYELLGGRPGRFTPLASASEDENRVLRRCLTPGKSFASANEFYRELIAVAEKKVETVSRNVAWSEPPREVNLARPPSQATELTADRVVASRDTPRKRSWLLWLVPAGLVLAGAAALCWIFLFKSEPVAAPSLASKATPVPTKAIANRPPLVAGKPWTNSLGMRFVPLGDIQFAVWQTRVQDFEAFVQATGYDAVGGMSSAVTQNGFKLNGLSWKDPGFVQTAGNPVVGVSWEDADQFCDWLTRKERNEGMLPPSQRYRLPTDLEWSAAIGLPREPGSTPEERSGSVKSVYPWGNSFPPPNDFGNYAGSESRAGAPPDWPVIAGYHDAFARTGPVTEFKPNQAGLCSLGGNVWEWCQDKYENGLNWRTLRGSSWATSRAEETLSSYRRGFDPYFRRDDVGFRCVIASDGGEQ
ncbi:MAG: SUMF1/EgtB/PvdO family nonheme iron enzyme [Verrucomicrobia bacterium]|nr:SUMF1/EgtB/PvdO family nonheme iron enzyme [Verrucomicrobiota bacterium]